MRHVKKLAAIVIILAAMTTCSMAEALDTYHSVWYKVRAENDEDGATFSAVYDITTAGDYASKSPNSVANQGPFKIVSRPTHEDDYYSHGAMWLFSICGKNFDDVDDTFSFIVVGWGRNNGFLQVIAEGDGVLGTQAVIKYPDSGSDALGPDVTVTDANFTNSTTTFTVTDGGFDGMAADEMVYISSPNSVALTSGYYDIDTYTDVNTIVISDVTSTDDIDTGNISIYNNPVFWADTINVDSTDLWPSVAVYNSGNNQVAMLAVDTTGLEWIQFIFYDASGAGGEAGSLSVYGRRY